MRNFQLVTDKFRLAIYVVSDEGEGIVVGSSMTHDILASRGNERLLTAVLPPASTQARIQPELPNGPYLLSTGTGNVLQAFRMYPDHQLAFTETTVEDGQGGFISLPASIQVRLCSPILFVSRSILNTTGIHDQSGCSAITPLFQPNRAEAACRSKPH